MCGPNKEWVSRTYCLVWVGDHMVLSYFVWFKNRVHIKEICDDVNATKQESSLKRALTHPFFIKKFQLCLALGQCSVIYFATADHSPWGWLTSCLTSLTLLWGGGSGSVLLHCSIVIGAFSPRGQNQYTKHKTFKAL